jgi:SNF2 family DNA or RNA helicase
MQQFEFLKKKTVGYSAQQAGKAVVSLLLDFDETGAFLLAVDDRGKPVSVEFQHASSGRMQDLLRALSVLRQRQGFHIDWQGGIDRVYIQDHDYLIELARQAKCLRLTSGTGVVFSDQVGCMELQLAGGTEENRSVKKGRKKKEEKLEWKLVFRGSQGTVRAEESRLLSERYILVADTIHEIKPLGENFTALPLFHTAVSPRDLANYLALVCSSFSGVTIRYLDYGVRVGQAIHSQPAVIFEDVDSHDGLRLSVSPLVEGYAPEFFSDYAISQVADINEMEKTVVIREVVSTDSQAAVRKIRSLLTKHKKQLSMDTERDFFQDNALFVVEKDLAAAFLYQELAGLLEQYILLGTEKLSRYKIKPVSKPALSLRLEHGIDFLEGEGTLTVDNEEFSLVQLLRRYRKKGFITLSNGINVILQKKYVERLQRIFDHKEDRLRISFFDLPLVEELIDQRLESSSLPRTREIFTGFNTISSTRPRLPKINGKLRSYQKYGYKWLRYLHKHSLGGCLADDMGLGKTLQAIALLASVAVESSSPSLIVMPKTLLFNWDNEIKTFYPDLSVYTWYGSNRDMEEACSHQVILTTYGMVRNSIEQFKEQPFFYVILDESQHIKNTRSQVSKAVMLLNADHRLALSGTPVENNLGELYSLFRFLNPAMFRSEEEFSRRYGRPIQHNNDADAIHELRSKVYPFILRRLKKEVLTDLPDKMEQMLYVEMGPEQQQLYEERRLFYKTAIDDQISSQGLNKSQFFILQALLELRQLASCPESRSDGAIISPKRELLTAQLQEAVANGHKALVFANFLSVIESVSQDLEDAGIPYLSMTGATRDRQRLVERFQNDDTVRVFVMTLKTGGVGLNLTAADTIFIFDPWWNLSAENQAIDRSHRIGQQRTVFCYKLICRNTIEEKMVELQEKKRELLDSIISSDSSAVKKLTAEDVDFMLS